MTDSVVGSGEGGPTEPGVVPGGTVAGAEIAGGGAGNHLAGYPPPRMVYTLRISQVSSFVIYCQRRTKVQTGDLAQLEEFYHQVRLHNMTAGMLSITGLIWSPMSMSRNKKALLKLRQLAASAPVAGWYRDPSGRHGQRWWDGGRWTEQVGDTTVNSDPVG